jgi:hypothetical protein
MVAPYNIDDSVPTPEEIAKAVGRLKIDKASGPSGMKAEFIKE